MLAISGGSPPSETARTTTNQCVAAAALPTAIKQANWRTSFCIVVLFRSRRVAEAGKKQIVICADDFGMNPAVDAGILHLAGMGRLNATSCLVEGPSFAQGAKQLSETGLQLGLHLNFTESLQQPGLYLPVSTLIARAWLRRLDIRSIERQVAR